MVEAVAWIRHRRVADPARRARTLTLAALALAGPLCAQPARLVSTAPGVTEILHALGLGPKVVGVTTFCRHPAEAQSKPKVGTFIQPDFERIAAQRPDLVFIIRNPIDLAAKLRRLGLRVEELKLDTVDEILASIRQAGRAAGAGAAGDALAARLRAELDQLRAPADKRPRVTALYIIDRTPGTLQGMFAAGPGSYIDELLALAGGRNLAPAGGGPFPKISLEHVLASDPEVIIDMGDSMQGRAATAAARRAKLALWAQYPNLRAVRNRRVYDVSSDQFAVPGPRLAEAARALEALLREAPR